MIEEELDDLIRDAIKVVCQYDAASASLIQRRLSIGYARAARLIDQLETLKVVSSSDGSSKPRRVLVQNAEEFIKNLSPLKLPPTEDLPPLNTNYKPRKALFLPKEYLGNKNPMEMVLGNDNKDKPVKVDFGKIGNLLIIGTPISKKHELIETFLVSVLSNFTTKEVNLIVYDSTSSYLKFKNIPHLISPIITDWDKATSALRWCMAETDRRFKLRAEGNKVEFPEVYFIYNFDFKDTEKEDALKRLTSMAYRAGVHLIICADQLSDIPKSVRDNIPVRLIFDKFGEYKADFEFKEITPITTIPIKSSEAEKYLKGI